MAVILKFWWASESPDKTQGSRLYPSSMSLLMFSYFCNFNYLSRQFWHNPNNEIYPSMQGWKMD